MFPPGVHVISILEEANVEALFCSDLLKMDIEFAEFEAMDGLVHDFSAESGMELPIGQFLVEIHFFGSRQSAKGYLNW